MAFCGDANSTKLEGVRSVRCGTFQQLITLILRFNFFQMYLILKPQSSFPSCSVTIRSNQAASFEPQGIQKHGLERNELSQQCQKILRNKDF
jgi:hypothetical protein